MKLRELVLRPLLFAFVAMALLSATGTTLSAQRSSEDAVYRILILDRLAEAKAGQLRNLLESWGYSPIYIDQRNGEYRVMYGDFRDEAAAAAVMQKFRDQEGLTVNGVVRVTRTAEAAAALPKTTFAIAVPFVDRDMAYAYQARMAGEGFSPISVVPGSRFYEVYIGKYNIDDASKMLVRFRAENPNARLIESTKIPQTPAEEAATAQPTPQPTPQAEAVDITPEILQSPLWTRLTEDQKREVIQNMMIKGRLREGDALAGEVVNLNDRFDKLDKYVKQVIDEIEKNKASDDKRRTEINDLWTEGNNLSRAGKYQDAVIKLQKIVDLDKDNRFGQKQTALRYIATLESKIKGEAFPGEEQNIDRHYQALKAQAETLGKSNSMTDKQSALQIWRQIQLLNPNKYGPNAETQINQITQWIEGENKRQSEAQNKSSQQTMFILYGLGGVVGVLAVFVLIVWMFGRKRHADLMRKVQEITSIRPMREIGGSQAQPLLEPGAETPLESDIFTPQTGAAAGAAGADADEQPKSARERAREKKQAKAQEKQKKAEPKSETAGEPGEELFGGAASDDIFGDLGGGEPSGATAGGSTGDLGFDDIFGDVSGAAQPMPTGPATVEASKPAQGEAGDDAFSSLFGEEREASSGLDAKTQELPTVEKKSAPPAPPAPKPKPAAASVPVPPPAPEPERKSEDFAPISFDDLLGANESRAGEQTATSNLGTERIPEEALAGIGGTHVSPPVDADMDNRLKDSPFANIFDEQPSLDDVGSSTDVSPVEIPSIDLGSSGPAGSREEEMTGIEIDVDAFGVDRTGADTDLPSFSLDDQFSESRSTTMPAVDGGGCELDFESDRVGGKPNGWEGEYDYASLTVQSDTPPSNGSHQYIQFTKKDGTGKALFSYRFPDITGRVAIEFDLRCNEKNKFLLGIYVERDADFQQSINTKILRSEAQTTPMIHLQGEAAPYLLGSWVHIKYVVDLKNGVLNGYVDSTHVVRDMALQQTPERLNTLSIRDNINTTGVLLLDNIKIYNVA